MDKHESMRECTGKEILYSATIPLPPITKKNSQNIYVTRNTAKPRPFIAPSKAYRQYREKAQWLLPPTDSPISEPVNVCCVFYTKTRGNVDLVNLLEAACDILVDFRIIEDDGRKIIKGHDGSRVRYDKVNPRTEITISRYEEEEN